MKRAEAFPAYYGRTIDRDAVLRAASALFSPGEAHELRGLPSGRSRLASTVDLDRLVASVEFLADDRGVYWTLNPVRSDLGDKAAKVSDVIRRRWLLIDADPVKEDMVGPDGKKEDRNATAAEKAAALAVHLAVAARLKSLGWPDPVRVDSGNGYHLLYRVDLPNDQQAQKVLRGVLHRLAADHDTAGAKVDKSVHNASRVSKLPGTWAKKGPDSPERPHRMAGLIEVPREVLAVSRGQLEALAGLPTEKPKPESKKPTATASAGENHWPSDPRPRRPSGDPNQAWFRKAIEGECGKVAGAANGERHNQLIKSAYALGGLIPAGLDKGEAAAALLIVARRVDGEDRDDHEKVIDDGLTNGAKEPRQGPAETNGVHKSGTPKQGQKTEHHESIDFGSLEDDDLGLISASRIIPRAVNWLWRYRLAAGTMAMMAGDGGLGKSMLALAIAAKITRGEPWFDGAGYAPLGGAVILSAEDNPHDTIVPRLMALGADLDRVTIQRARVVIRRDGKEPLIHPMSFQDRDYWRAVFDRRPDTILFNVDPLPSYLGRGVNDSKNNEIRNILEPFLTEIIEPRGICLLSNSHLNKSVDARTPLQRIAGTIAYGNLPRNVHVVIRDPEDPAKRYFCQPKCNNAPDDLPSLCYRVERREIEVAGGEIIETAIPVFDPQPVRVNLRELMSGKERKPDEASEIDRASEWLAARLKAGPVGSLLVAKEGDAEIGRKWPGAGPISHIMGRVKWWRERVLKGKLGGSSRKAPVFQGPYLFVLATHESGGLWPPTAEAIRLACEAEAEVQANEAKEVNESNEDKEANESGIRTEDSGDQNGGRTTILLRPAF